MNLLNSNPELMQNALSYLKTNFKSINHYFLEMGFDYQQIDQLKTIFSENFQ
ncbi:tyrosine-protein phosphatase [Facklamia sp. DSM 111019]|nr:tyrosine-protein phosphatase [Facklamia lactis]